MSKSNILFDLRIALNKGYCGIGQDSCLIFNGLIQHPSYQVDGLLYSSNSASLMTRYKKIHTSEETLQQTAYFFHEVFFHHNRFYKKFLAKPKIEKFVLRRIKQFELYPVDEGFGEMLWRTIFGKYLNPKLKDSILKNHFYYSNLNEEHFSLPSQFQKNLYFDTSGYDYIIFPDLRTVNVSPKTIKIVRYHDAIPLTDPDFASLSAAHAHANKLRQCKEDSYFVCNSEPTRQILINLVPSLEEKSFAVPSSTSYPYKKVNNLVILKHILMTRLSDHILKGEQLQAIREHLTQQHTNFDYILNIATLDPKKNVVTLIEAWSQLITKYDVKLIILANSGWLSGHLEEKMRPYLETGKIIHLASATSMEMEYLYSHAKAFVFPSYAEGFGTPPLEALRCECPVIVSDIPAHRWVLGEAALYCDAYSVNDFTQALTRLLYSQDALALRETLISRGLKRSELYSHENLAAQWHTVLETIKTKHMQKAIG